MQFLSSVHNLSPLALHASAWFPPINFLNPLISDIVCLNYNVYLDSYLVLRDSSFLALVQSLDLTLTCPSTVDDALVHLSSSSHQQLILTTQSLGFHPPATLLDYRSATCINFAQLFSPPLAIFPLADSHHQVETTQAMMM